MENSAELISKSTPDTSLHKLFKGRRVDHAIQVHRKTTDKWDWIGLIPRPRPSEGEEEIPWDPKVPNSKRVEPTIDKGGTPVPFIGIYASDGTRAPLTFTQIVDAYRLQREAVPSDLLVPDELRNLISREKAQKRSVTSR